VSGLPTFAPPPTLRLCDLAFRQPATTLHYRFQRQLWAFHAEYACWTLSSTAFWFATTSLLTATRTNFRSILPHRTRRVLRAAGKTPHKHGTCAGFANMHYGAFAIVSIPLLDVAKMLFPTATSSMPDVDNIVLTPNGARLHYSGCDDMLPVTCARYYKPHSNTGICLSVISLVLNAAGCCTRRLLCAFGSGVNGKTWAAQ